MAVAPLGTRADGRAPAQAGTPPAPPPVRAETWPASHSPLSGQRWPLLLLLLLPLLLLLLLELPLLLLLLLLGR